MDLPTYTNIWRIEKRLYKLYDVRLPVPMPITWIGIFAAITVPYVVFLIAIGVPFNHTLVWLYILPPGVLTWLTTRPVIEGKRLPELVISQVRYLTEPRAWCRMAPVAEKDEMLVSVQVWHGRPPKVRPKRASARAWPGAPAPRTASTENEAGAVAPVSAAASAPDSGVLPSPHEPVPMRASARLAAAPLKAGPQAQLAWSPWPRGSGLQTKTPGPAGDRADVPDRRPTWVIGPSPAAKTPDPGRLDASVPAAEPSELSAAEPQAEPRLADSGTISVTPGQLGDIRAWWCKLAPAAAALRELGFSSEGNQVAAIARAMSAARFAVQIACIACRSPVLLGVGMGGTGDPQPGGVMCDSCSTGIDRSALADPADHGRNAGEYSD